MINNKNIKAVIFDMDGVIVSTDEFHFNSWKEIIKINFNYELKSTDKYLVRGVSREDSLNLLLKSNGLIADKKNFDKMLIEKNNHYIKSLEKISPGDEKDNIKDLLNFLKSRNIIVALASSSKNAKMILEKLNMKECFERIVDVNLLTKLKPDPEIFIEALRLCGDIDPKDVIVIEDAQAGIDGGKRAGMQVIAFSSGEELYNYDELVNNHLSIIEILK